MMEKPIIRRATDRDMERIREIAVASWSPIFDRGTFSARNCSQTFSAIGGSGASPTIAGAGRGTPW